MGEGDFDTVVETVQDLAERWPRGLTGCRRRALGSAKARRRGSRRRSSAHAGPVAAAQHAAVGQEQLLKHEPG